MIDFVGTSPFLRIAFWVATATMHFHIAKTDLFLRNNYFHIQGIPGNNLALMKNWPERCNMLYIFLLTRSNDGSGSYLQKKNFQG